MGEAHVRDISFKENKMSVLHLTSENFDETIGNGRVLVDFWAGWCMPCKMLAPVIEQLAAEYEGRVVVAKVDIDNEESLAVRYDVFSIPTVVLFKNGSEEKRIVGVQPIESYQEALNQ